MTTSKTKLKIGYPIIIRNLESELAPVVELHHRISETSNSLVELLEERKRRIEAGFYGEQKIDKIIESLPFPKPFLVIPNFHASISPSRYIQIDLLIVTTRYLALIEIKNIRGHIEFLVDPNRLRRTENGIEQYFDCPFSQLARNILAVKTLLSELKVSVPLQPALVFAHSKASIVSTDKRFPILFPKQLDLFFHQLNDRPPVLSSSDFNKLSKALQARSLPFSFTTLIETLGIDPLTLKRGIFCEACGGEMERLALGWRCSKCEQVDYKAIRRTTINLIQLIGPRYQVRDFQFHMGIASRRTIQRTLQELNIPRFERGRRTYYGRRE